MTFRTIFDELIEDYTQKLANRADAAGILYGPTFVVPICWIALHEASCWSKETESTVAFIESQNENTYEEQFPRSGYRMYGFDATANGIMAMQKLEALCGEVQYIRKAEDGRYIELNDELKTQLGLDSPYYSDFTDPAVFKEFIVNFQQSYRGRFLPPSPNMT